MPTMRALQVPAPGKPFQLVERPLPAPAPGQVRIKVQACGVCHSDSLTKEGHWPGIHYPRVPGHEVVGTIDALGTNVPEIWKAGDYVGVGWFGGNCGYCDPCRRGHFILCTRGQITGITYDGGYADAMLAPFSALARIPQEFPATDAGPLMCAGITTFNALRNAGVKPGATVAVLGIGGLGHLAIQYAAKMGFRTLAIARGQDKAPLAKQLGAHDYIDSHAGNVAEALQKFGGADLVLATVTNAQAMADTLPGLAPDGKLLILGAPAEPMQISALPLIGGRRSIAGWPSGSSIDSEDTLAFSALSHIKPMCEVFPLDKAEEAYARMMSGKARFRVVLTM